MFLTALETTGQVAKAVTAEMLQGVLNELIGLLPVCIPPMIGAAGIRKAVGFLQGIIHSM